MLGVVVTCPAPRSCGRHRNTSFASSLVEGDNDDGSVDAYLYDRQTGTAEWISQSPAGFAHSSAGGISADGRFVTFTTQDTTFLTPNANAAALPSRAHVPCATAS